jgi:hypothetical protein
VGDVDKLAGTLPNAAAAKLGYSVLGNHAVHDVFEGRNCRARVQLRRDAGYRFVRGRRVQDDERLAVFGENRPSYEVRLAARRGPVLATQGLGDTLAQEIHFEGGIDDGHVILPGDVAGIVGVVDGPELYAGVPVHELVQSPASQRVGRDDLVPVGALAGAVDDPLLDEIYEPIGEQFGVHAEVLMIAQQLQHLVRDRPDPGLQRGPVRDALRDKLGDPAVGILGWSRRQLRERVIGFAPPDDLA